MLYVMLYSKKMRFRHNHNTIDGYTLIKYGIAWRFATIIKHIFGILLGYNVMNGSKFF